MTGWVFVCWPRLTHHSELVRYLESRTGGDTEDYNQTPLLICMYQGMSFSFCRKGVSLTIIVEYFSFVSFSLSFVFKTLLKAIHVMVKKLVNLSRW